MQRRMIRVFFLIIMLLGLPLLGVAWNKGAVSQYLEFPPQTRYVEHAPFSWAAFLFLSLFILMVIAPFLLRGLKGRAPGKTGRDHTSTFPWWGWIGILLGVMSWVFAWNRFSWFAPLQAHTFTPLWLSYIITINALTFRKTGHCLLVHRPLFFLSLFPLSAAFWWFFEFLNRFVQNWYYVGKAFGPVEYFIYATLPFSTVLPAVTGTREWLLGFSWPNQKFRSFLPIHISRPKGLAWVNLLIAGMGLTFIGVWPNVLFPLLWISPLLIIVSLQTLWGEHHLFSDVVKGDWRGLVTAALAALICGIFWEMWNVYSFAKWKYSIPYVHRFQVFEMPLLGYAGYIPFGLECIVIAEMFLGDLRPVSGTKVMEDRSLNESENKTFRLR